MNDDHPDIQRWYGRVLQKIEKQAPVRDSFRVGNLEVEIWNKKISERNAAKKAAKKLRR